MMPFPPNPTPHFTPRLYVSFWSRVAMDNTSDDPCWLWMGATNIGGYGCGRTAQGPYLSHRVAWSCVNGPIPDGLYVLHRCDNRLCVNPAHLFVGTHDANMHDMRDKGRRRGLLVGSALRNTPLTERDIPIICTLAHIGCTHKEIAGRYGVKEPAIWKIVNGRSWEHVPRPVFD